jgi:hypothetical protein
MHRFAPPIALGLLLVVVPGGRAYVEVPYTLGRVCNESTHIMLVEVARVNKDKGLIIYKKLQDLKGKHPHNEIKHNIGKRGFHPREWQNVMSWAEEGKKAVFFHNGGASETCIGDYWYQAYAGNPWWGMSHAEPFMLRTYCGTPEKLAGAVTALLAGKEIVVPCMVDGNKELLHQRKAKLQRLKASLKLQDYNAKRDFVGWGGDGDEDIPEFKTYVLLPESTPGWKFLPAARLKPGERWVYPDHDDGPWRLGKAPLGYGEAELAKRSGTTIEEKGQDIVFRRTFEVPSDLLAQKGVVFRLNVASDDHAVVHFNGEVVDRDEGDHELSYWNREVEVPAKFLKPGRNLVAVLVRNKPGSSDLYLDMAISAQVPVPKVAKKPAANTPATAGTGALKAVLPDKPSPLVVVDREQRTVTVPCVIAPRKLPNLNDIYPIEVIATYPAPQGQKAHETVVTFKEVKPSDVHRALELLGVKPGKPAKGQDAQAQGPELKLFLELPGPDGKPRRVEVEKALVHRDTGKPLPPLKWHFTGSTLRQPDPEKDQYVYGADLSGTLIALFPVTDETVIQSHLTMKEEPLLKLETDKKALPREGIAVKLIIQVK